MNNASLKPESLPGFRSGRDRWPGSSAVGACLRTFSGPPRAEESREELQMKMKETIRVVPQPQPFTPGLTKAMIREHIQRLCERCLLDHAPRTLEDWVLVERDLIEELQGKFS